MKYFIDEIERKASHSTCYHEFFIGKWDENTNAHWNQDSMNIDDDLLNSIGLGSLIASVIKDYAPFGITEIHKGQWEQIYTQAEKIGGELFRAVQEIAPWVEDAFKQHETFTILGI